MRITLVCAAGMSTSMLMKAMDKYAVANGIDAAIIAVPESKLDSVLNETDVVLIGPQMGFIEPDVKAKAEPIGVPVAVIPITDYGTMNGGNVLNLAFHLAENKKCL